MTLALLRWAVLGLFAAFFSSCTSVPQKLDVNAFYKRDMKITVNDYKGEGVLVVPHSEDGYKFEIKAKGKLDLFTFTTCHREISKEEAGQGGIFGDRKKVKLDYIPSHGLETGTLCPVHLGGYERIKGRHSWGYVDFEGPENTLPARVLCNGNQYNARGVSICQAKVGLIQEISFPVDVLYSEDPGCPLQITSSDDKRFFRYTPTVDTCVFVFMDDDERAHRHTVIGYEHLLIREN